MPNWSSKEEVCANVENVKATYFGSTYPKKEYNTTYLFLISDLSMQGAQPLFNLLHPLIFYLYISNKNATHASVPLLPRSVGSISYFNYYYCFVRYEFQCLFFKAAVHKSSNVPFWTSVLWIPLKYVRVAILPKWRTNTLVTSQISWDWKLPFLRRQRRRFIDSPFLVHLCAHCSKHEPFLNLSPLKITNIEDISQNTPEINFCPSKIVSLLKLSNFESLN